MRNWIAGPAALALTLAGCGGSTTPAQVVAPQDYPGVQNQVPATPAAGASRPGQIYDVYIQGPKTGDKIAFTVFEPATFAGGKTYPLVLHSHGFGASRQRSLSQNPISGALSPGNVDQLVAHDYGVISIDERGHGQSSGTIRVMDPDAEGQDLLAVLDWADARLNWIQRDGDGVPELGSIGGSYGGMYQYLIHNIDPRHRLRAMVPQIAPNDLTYSLFPNDTLKGGWDVFLFAAGEGAGSGIDRGHFDPFITRFFVQSLTTNQVSQDVRDFFYYHSNQYFCGDQSVATNGGPGTSPGYAPRRGSKVDAMLFQGFRDTLFDFNEAYANYQCLKSQGGDVRLLSYQYGHNAVQVVPDPGALLFQPALDFLDTRCGDIDVNAATLAFFDEHLKGVAGAADRVVPRQICLSLTKGDAVLVDQVSTGKSGLQIALPGSTVVTGVLDVPVAFDTGFVAASAGNVIGGIPHLAVDVEDTLPLPVLDKDPIVFVGLGQMRKSVPGVWDLIDNQLTPLRGYGAHDVDLAGVAERLSPGDRLAVLFYGGSDQYHVTGDLNLAQPTVTTVKISGKVWLPLLGPLENAANGS